MNSMDYFKDVPFSSRFMALMNLLDNEHGLSHDVRIGMYEELLDATRADI